MAEAIQKTILLIASAICGGTAVNNARGGAGLLTGVGVAEGGIGVSVGGTAVVGTSRVGEAVGTSVGTGCVGVRGDAGRVGVGVEVCSTVGGMNVEVGLGLISGIGDTVMVRVGV